MFAPCQIHTCKYTLPCWRLKHFASVSSLLAFCTGRYCTKLMAHWSSLDFVVLLWSCVTKVLKCQLSPVFSSTNYSLQFQAFNLFWVTFEYSVRKSLISFFCMWIFSFSHCVLKGLNHRCVPLAALLRSTIHKYRWTLFYSTGLNTDSNSSTTLLWLSKLCGTFRNQIVNDL